MLVQRRRNVESSTVSLRRRWRLDAFELRYAKTAKSVQMSSSRARNGIIFAPRGGVYVYCAYTQLLKVEGYLDWR